MILLPAHDDLNLHILHIFGDAIYLFYTFNCKVGCIEASSTNTVVREESDVHGIGVGYYHRWWSKSTVSLLVYLKVFEPHCEKTYLLTCITKTCLFKYTENLTIKK